MGGHPAKHVGISDAAMLARRRPPAAFETSQDLGTSRRQRTIEPYTTFPHLKRGAEWLQVAHPGSGVLHCGKLRFGRASTPMMPHPGQTIRGPKVGTGM
jgi:hypothetical protein